MATEAPHFSLFHPLPEFASHPALINPPTGLAYSNICANPEIDDITNPPPLTTDDFPDNEEGHVLAGASARVEHTLTKGFIHPTLNPTAFLTRDEWLLIVANLLRSIKESIAITTRSADSPIYAFDNVSQEETQLITSIESLTLALNTHFSPAESDSDDWDQCMSCLSRFHVSLTEMNWNAIVGAASGDICAAHTTMINTQIRKLSSELDSWAAEKRAYLQDLLVTGITSDTSPSIPENELRIKAWLTTTRDEARACAWAMLVHDELSQILPIWADEKSMHARASILQQIDTETHEYEWDLHIQIEVDSRAAAAEYGNDMLAGYKAEVEAHARAEADDHYLSLRSSFLLSTECAAKDEVNSTSAETFTALCQVAIDEANLEFDKFKHQLRIDTNKCKARAETQVVVSTKTDSKSTLRSSRKANRHHPVSTKSTPSHSSPSSPSIPAAVRVAAPSPETITPQASSAVLPGISADLKLLGHKASPMHPAPENTREASVVHTVMPDTALAEGSLPSTKVTLMVSDTVDCGPPLNSIEQMILDAPSQLSSIVFPPSQDMSIIIATINSSILAAVGAVVQPLDSWLSSSSLL